MVLEIVPDRKIHQDFNSETAQEAFGTDSRKLKKLRGVDCASRKNDLFASAGGAGFTGFTADKFYASRNSFIE